MPRLAPGRPDVIKTNEISILFKIMLKNIWNINVSFIAANFFLQKHCQNNIKHNIPISWLCIVFSVITETHANP